MRNNKEVDFLAKAEHISLKKNKTIELKNKPSPFDIVLAKTYEEAREIAQPFIPVYKKRQRHSLMEENEWFAVPRESVEKWISYDWISGVPLSDISENEAKVFESFIANGRLSKDKGIFYIFERNKYAPNSVKRIFGRARYISAYEIDEADRRILESAIKSGAVKKTEETVYRKLDMRTLVLLEKNVNEHEKRQSL